MWQRWAKEIKEKRSGKGRSRCYITDRSGVGLRVVVVARKTKRFSWHLSPFGKRTPFRTLACSEAPMAGGRHTAGTGCSRRSYQLHPLAGVSFSHAVAQAQLAGGTYVNSCSPHLPSDRDGESIHHLSCFELLFPPATYFPAYLPTSIFEDVDSTGFPNKQSATQPTSTIWRTIYPPPLGRPM